MSDVNYDRLQRNAVAAVRRRLARRAARLAQDAEELHIMANKLRAIIARHQYRSGACVRGLENARREIEWSSQVMRSE